MMRTQVIGFISAVFLLGMVLNLVRRRRLREEYSLLWLAAALFYLVMALKPDLIKKLSRLLGISNDINTLTFFGLLFFVLILIHYSVKLSTLTNQIKDMAQQLAIMDGEQYKLNEVLEKKNNQQVLNVATQPTIEQKDEQYDHFDISKRDPR
jgi:hypothetical protein